MRCQVQTHDPLRMKLLPSSLLAHGWSRFARIKYEQTIGDIKRAVEKKLGIPADKQQLFWHNKELTQAPT